MEIQRYSELKKALTSKFNIFLFVLAVLLILDYSQGTPIVSRIMRFQFELRGITSNYRLFAIFGTFDNIHDLSRRFELVFFGLCIFGVTASLFKGWLSAMRMKT